MEQTTMTKQEQIRDKAERLMQEIYGFSPEVSHTILDGLFACLHSQGVVIKVDYYVSKTEVNCPSCHASFLDKVEPLIKEK